MALKRVFEPIQIGTIEVPNRIVRTAHDTGFAKPDIGEDFIAYHAARAKGGCGLSILEAARVHPSTGLDMRLYGDAIVPGFRRLMSAVRPHGMRVFQQLWHGGNTYPAADGGPPWTVSNVAGYWGVVGRTMSLADIQELKRAFVTAALACVEGGLDGVELHGCHGYIFHQFLSPFYNNREDAYGGSLENRSHFLFETAREIRAAVGRDFVVGIRLGASELPGGISEVDNQQILRQLQAEKLIDFVDLSVGDYYRFDTMTSGMHSPSGYELPSSAQIGLVARVPRIVTGRIRTLEEAEEVLRSGKAELVSMVRAQIADPQLVRKTRDSSAEDVRPCIACNQGCIGGLFRSGRMGCAVNPAVGVETVLDETSIPRSAAPKRVLVIGGGPGGMEAARIAALAGHNVILAEAQSSLGGSLNIARLAPRLQTIGDIAAWLDREVHRLGVEVRLGAYMEAQDVRAVQADVIIVATGSTPRGDGFQLANPSLVLKGRELPHVISTHELLLEAKAARGSSAVVLDTVGHYEALAAMEFLLQKGMFVTYVTHALSLTPAAHATWRDLPALERFYALGEFEILLRHEMLEITATECVVHPLQAAAHQTRSVRADTVVLITPNAPLSALYDELREDAPTLHLIGDALSPRDVQVAIAEGHRTARAIA